MGAADALFVLGAAIGMILGVVFGYFGGMTLDSTDTNDELAQNFRDIKVRVHGAEFESNGTKISLSIKYSGDEKVDFDWREAVIIIDETQYPATGAMGLDPVIYEGATTRGYISFPPVDEGKFDMKMSLNRYEIFPELAVFSFEIDPEEFGR